MTNLDMYDIPDDEALLQYTFINRVEIGAHMAATLLYNTGRLLGILFLALAACVVLIVPAMMLYTIFAPGHW